MRECLTKKERNNSTSVQSTTVSRVPSQARCVLCAYTQYDTVITTQIARDAMADPYVIMNRETEKDWRGGRARHGEIKMFSADWEAYTS